MEIAFQSVQPNSANPTDTLTLTFDQDVDGLSLDNITVEGATTTSLIKDRVATGTYTLGISSITLADGAQSTVTVQKDGVTFNPASKSFTVSNSSVTPPPTPPAPPSVDDSSDSDDDDSSSDHTTYTRSALRIINNPVGTRATPPAVNAAVENAVSKGSDSANAQVTFSNYQILAPDGVKAINDMAAKATAGTKVRLGLLANFDTVQNGKTLSRITMNPADLTPVVNKNVKLGVSFNQKDKGVQSVGSLFKKHFSNRIVTVVYDTRSPLAVNAEFAAKLDLSGLDTSSLHFYSYDLASNTYDLISNPNYFVDTNGYTHITAPFGGAILITDRALALI